SLLTAICRRVLDRPPPATTVESIFGWNRPFDRESVDSEIFYLLEGRVDDHPTHRRTALPGSAPFFIALPRSVRRLLPLRGRLIGRGVGLRRSFAAGSGTLFGIWPRPAVCRRDGLLGGL